ncbi:MAG TPA: AMP-binding protein [Streptosporangiaceae bacterium]|nr:AMP-binding protein [Streptosporangiaceae bacterium]
MQYAVSGGAPPGERRGHFFRGAGVTVLEGYGLTETSAAATVNTPGHNEIGTVGQPLPGVTVRIADDGEILVKGPNVFSRYWRNDAPTGQVLVSQAMVIGEGRPYITCLVTLDRAALQFWKRQHGRPAGATPGDLAGDPELIADIQLAVDDANKAVSRADDPQIPDSRHRLHRSLRPAHAIGQSAQKLSFDI